MDNKYMLINHIHRIVMPVLVLYRCTIVPFRVQRAVSSVQCIIVVVVVKTFIGRTRWTAAAHSRPFMYSKTLNPLTVCMHCNSTAVIRVYFICPHIVTSDGVAKKASSPVRLRHLIVRHKGILVHL